MQASLPSLRPKALRVVTTHWVAQAFKKVHTDHKDAIIAYFKSVGLSLPTDGSEDHLL